VLGDGTAAKIVEDALAKSASNIPVRKVDESHTSEQARALYIEQNPPRGLKKLIPRTLRVPDAPYDDYVAVILARGGGMRMQKRTRFLHNSTLLTRIRLKHFRIDKN